MKNNEKNKEGGLETIKNLMLNPDNRPMEHRISEKTLETITLKESLRLGNITKGEQFKLFKMLGYNTIYFKKKDHLNTRQKNMTTLERMVDDYLNLSTSVNGKLLYHISEMFKSNDIPQMPSYGENKIR